MKSFVKELWSFILCVCAVFTAIMLYAHRRVIRAALKGEPMPEPSEAAKKWCPPVKKKYET